MKAEEWKQIVIDDVEYDYSVSNYGRVRNDKTGRILKARKKQDNYLHVGLYKNKHGKQCYIHRLVASAFIPNPNGYTDVNHIDENKSNNHVDNLEWCSRKHNINHGTRTERMSKTQGKRVRCVETQVIYDSTSECARQTGFKQQNISLCCKERHRTCGGLHWEFVD